jgi:uncharacterized protein (DUF1684 family)
MYTHHFLFILIFILACNDQKINNWQSSWNNYKLEKDSLFKHETWSPIKTDERANFIALNYFPYNESLRFFGPILFHEQIDTTFIYGTKSGDIRPALKYAYFVFTYKNAEYRLQIYKLASINNPQRYSLFLGFTDESTGKDTYGAGRYIDITENPENFYIVDFNYAYNPYCAYNERYTCALPSRENHLPFRVTAGEKLYKNH